MMFWLFHRRMAACVLLILAIVGGEPVAAQPAAVTWANLLEPIGKGLSALAKGLDDLAEVVRRHGGAGWTAAQGKLTRDELLEILAASENLASSQSVAIAGGLDRYISQPNPQNWDALAMSIDSIVLKVGTQLKRVQEIRNDFVVSPAYGQMLEALQAREAALKALRSLPPPQTKDELDALRSVSSDYKKLIEKLRATNRVLAEQIKGT